MKHSGAKILSLLCLVLLLTLLPGMCAGAYADTVSDVYSASVFQTGSADFLLPAALVTIGEEAFAGIPAARVEIPERVTSIGPRAFADCPKLCEILIPASVESISDTAFEGSGSVKIYCWANSAAHVFADEKGIPYALLDGGSETPDPEDPPILPFIPFP